MSVRETAFQVLQMGSEVTPGTKVAATKRIASFGLVPTIRANVKEYKAEGFIVPTAYVLGKDYTEGKIDGFPAYNEIGLLLASVIAKPAGDVYTLKANTPNDGQTYSIEKGAAGGTGELFQHAVVTDFNLKGDRDELTLSGAMIGAQTLSGACSSNASVEAVPIPPGDVTIAVAGSDIEPFNWEFGISGRWKTKWVVNASRDSYVAIVEAGDPKITLKLGVEADSDGNAHLDRLRAGNALTVVTVTCSTTIGAQTYSLVFSINTKVSEVAEYSDEDGVYAYGFTLGATPAANGTVLTATLTLPA